MMKIICGWCHTQICYLCPICQSALEEPLREKERGRFMVCRSNIPFTSTDPRKVHTEIHFAIANMITRKAICPACYDKFESERHALSPEDTANHEQQLPPAARDRAARIAGHQPTEQVTVIPLCQRCHSLHKKEHPCPPTQQLTQEPPTTDALESAILDAATDQLINELEKGGES